MLDFLIEYGISDRVINKIEHVNSRAYIYYLYCNCDAVIKILKYFNELKINSIDELLIYRIEIFFNSLEDITKSFSKYDINYLVEQINNDFSFIDEIN